MNLNKLISDNIEVVRSSFLQPYLRDIYNSLTLNSNNNKLDKRAFTSFFFPMAYFLIEKLFSFFDSDKDGYLTCSDFVDGLIKLYYSDETELYEILFDLLDHNRNGKITLTDIGVLGKIMKIEKRFLENFNNIFLHFSNISKSDYTNLAGRNVLFRPFIDYIKKNRPFCEDNIKIFSTYNKHYSKSISMKKLRTDLTTIKETMYAKDEDESLLSEVQRDPIYDLTIPLFKRNKSRLCENGSTRKLTTIEKETVTEAADVIEAEEDVDEEEDDGYFKGKTMQPGSKKLSTVAVGIRRASEQNQHIPRLSISGKLNIINLIDCLANADDLECDHKGVIYRINQSNQVKRYMMVLKNKDLYLLKTSNKAYKQLIVLSDCSIEEHKVTYNNGVPYFCFKVIYQNSVERIYTANDYELVEWIREMKKNSGLKYIKDFYQFSTVIGKGSFSKVYIGQYNNKPINVAIKVISKVNNKNYDHELIHSELQVLMFQNHCNILKYLDHFEDSKNFYLVTEYINGYDMNYYLLRNKKLDTEHIKSIIYQLATAIKHLHLNGIAHRDIKPSNVMIRHNKDNGVESFHVYLIDFGLAKFFFNQFSEERVGTVLFTAPEVISGLKYSYKCDIWSLGILLYTLISGSLPFESDSERDLMEQITKYPVYFTNLNDEIAKDLILKCLIKDYDKRIDIDQFMNHKWFQL
jgi:tRNA A-37 threonylcarbamoyl transferase component Bud32/Ca2+-binding EF-hand superfamily protein